MSGRCPRSRASGLVREPRAALTSSDRLIAASQWERSAGKANGSPRRLSASGCGLKPSQGCVTEAARLSIGCRASALFGLARQ